MDADQDETPLHGRTGSSSQGHVLSQSRLLSQSHLLLLWTVTGLAWAGCLLAVRYRIPPNIGPFTPVAAPFQIVVWLLVTWLTVLVLRRTGAPAAVCALVAGFALALGVVAINWAVLAPGLYFRTHAYAFDAVADDIRAGTVPATSEYYGSELPFPLDLLSSTGRAAHVGTANQRAVLLPQAVGLVDGAIGYVHVTGLVEGDAAPSLLLDMFGDPARLADFEYLGGGWWYVG